MKKIFRNIIKVLSYILTVIIPKKKNLVVFGAMNGNAYGDNSRYVFEYAQKNDLGFESVWLTGSNQVHGLLRKKGFRVVERDSFLGFWVLFRANVGLFTNSLYDLSVHPFLLPRNIRLLALRHGKSVKRVRFGRKNHKMSKVEEEERKYESMLIWYVISTSEYTSEIQEECLQLGIEKSVITGYPRNDIFYDESRVPIVEDENTKILYAPSWRHGRKATKFFPFGDFEENELFEFLEKNKISIYLRPHKEDLKKYPELLKFLTSLSKKTKNIHLATHDVYPDVNELLPDFDALISDYSALYHDYLLLNKPMLFIPYDYDDFNKESGFLYDYEKYLPGAFVRNKKEFYKELLDLEKDNYKKKREELRDKIHKYQDGNSSKRVCDLIKKMLCN